MLATTIHKSNTTPHHQRWSDNQVLSPVSHTRDEEIAGLLSQSPIVCLMVHHRKSSPKAESRSGSTFVVHQNHTHYRCSPSIESPKSR
jgi:hypothetical protein